MISICLDPDHQRDDWKIRLGFFGPNKSILNLFSSNKYYYNANKLIYQLKTSLSRFKNTKSNKKIYFLTLICFFKDTKG